MAYGSSARLGISASQSEVEVEQEEETLDPTTEAAVAAEEKRIKDNPTMYDRVDQQINVDLPIKADLNAKETVIGLGKSAMKLRQTVLDSDASIDDTEERPLMEDCGIFLSGDGSPSYTFECLEAMDAAAYADIKNFGGGFHAS